MPRLLLLFAPVWALADTVTLTDGTFLRGKIERAAEGQLEITVPALGGAPQRIPLAKVESFRTEDAVAISMGGVVQRGLASATAGRVASSGGVETCELTGKFELWRETEHQGGKRRIECLIKKYHLEGFDHGCFATYAQDCSTHESLHHHPAIYGVTITSREFGDLFDA